jgi:hypothetical protein
VVEIVPPPIPLTPAVLPDGEKTATTVLLAHRDLEVWTDELRSRNPSANRACEGEHHNTSSGKAACEPCPTTQGSCELSLRRRAPRRTERFFVHTKKGGSRMPGWRPAPSVWISWWLSAPPPTPNPTEQHEVSTKRDRVACAPMRRPGNGLIGARGTGTACYKDSRH